MKKKHRSIVQRVLVILVGALVLNFVGGCFAFYKLEQSNISYIYHLTGELMNSSIREIEEQIEGIETVLYQIVVSNEVQEAGSTLISESNISSLLRSSCFTAITDCIQRGITSEQSIVCAGFLDEDANARMVASTRYYKLSEETARYLSDAAVAANGETIFLEGSEITGDENMLIMAKQVREKKNLSMKNIGVVVFMVDIARLGRTLTDTHDGIFILQDKEEGLTYILNDEENHVREQDIPAMEEGFFFSDIGGEQYYVVGTESSGYLFSYMILTPYSELFGDVRKVFSLYISIFAVYGTAITVAAFFFTKEVTKNIRGFIRHIQTLPGKELELLPLYKEENIRDEESFALQNAFNSMSMRINDLVRDNYAKQLLIKETQLKALQSQINPHFLYNTLNSVYWMAKTNGMSAAADMISSLGILLREAISDKEFVISIDMEMDLVCHYFIIQKHRYEDKLDFQFDIADGCGELAIPKFSIQPIAENAITYGLECMLESCKVTVRIFTDAEKGECICQVRNTGPAPGENLMERLRAGSVTPRGNGIGLLNIEKRVKSIFGEKYGLDVYREEKETVVQIRMKSIPLQEYQEGCRNGTDLQDDDCR